MLFEMKKVKEESLDELNLLRAKLYKAKASGKISDVEIENKVKTTEELE